MTYEVTLLIFGILLLLLGMIGKIKAREIEVGTNSSLVRVVTTIIGFILVVLSFNPEIPKILLSNFTNEITKSSKQLEQNKMDKSKVDNDLYSDTTEPSSQHEQHRVEKPKEDNTLYSSQNDEAVKAIRTTWMRLDDLFKNQEKTSCIDERTWLPNWGMRGFYCHIKQVLSYRYLQSLLKIPIFIKGPHSQGNLNFDAKYEFGYYNKEFVKWFANNAVIGINDFSIRVKIQPMFDRYLKQRARAYYVTYKYLQKNKRLLENTKQEYLKHMRNRTLTYVFLIEKFRLFSEQKEKEGLNIYEISTAGGFWVRRSIDGTDVEFFRALRRVLLTYDNDFVSTE